MNMKLGQTAMAKGLIEQFASSFSQSGCAIRRNDTSKDQLHTATWVTRCIQISMYGILQCSCLGPSGRGIIGLGV
jgi:hypothetical protein